MKRLLLFIVLFFAATTAFGQVSKLNTIKNPSLDELRKNFAKPHRDYSTGPLWTWNDMLTEEQVRSTLRDLAGQHVKQVWVHPRPGLMTPYLSDDWFRLWKVALDEAEKLDMNVWIYDENSYPSGFAGGFVPEALPDSRGMGLKFEEIDAAEKIDENIWYVFQPSGFSPRSGEPDQQTYKNITETAKKNGKLEKLENEQKYLVGKIHTTPQGGWFGGKWYVDLLKKGVTEKFIEITHESYKKNVGDQFGKRVPGLFTDEPHPAGSYVGTWVHWNDDIPVQFEKKFGYSLIDNLPSLQKKVGDWKKVRHNFHQLILELFVDRWSKPNFEWCEKNNLEWTGHYWEHGWPSTGHGPDNMAMYTWHQRPAIDLLMNTYNDKSPNAQFGNVRAGKELSSIANQMGRSRTLSENYGAGGWDIRFEDLKRLGDWSYAMGVNTCNEHLSYVTIRGARKRDHPQSFSYHVPWFEGYHVLADYFTRLSYVLSQGRQINRIVVLEPTTTAWMYQGEGKLNEIGQSFTDFVNALEHAQVEYDLASEDTISRFGGVDDKTFSINLGKYDLVILPPNMENVNKRTAELLAQYVKNGGKLLCAGDWPTLCDGSEPGGVEAQWLKLLVDLPNAERTSTADAVTAAKKRTTEDGISFNVPEGTTGVFHHRRRLPDCEIFFVCNVDQENRANISINWPAGKHLSLWSLQNGEIVNTRPGPADIAMYMLPSSSQLLVFTDTKIMGAGRGEAIPKQKKVFGSETTIKRLDDNVLTLDFVDVKIGDEERKGIYTYAANRWIFEKHGTGVVSRGGQSFFGNPWDSCVQFKDELITKTYPEGSGFEAVYRFNIDKEYFSQKEPGTERTRAVPGPFAIVIERADLYKIYCNNEPVAVQPESWWLDKSFGKIDISKHVKPGENEVKIVADPMTIYHELEPAYLLGDFSLRPTLKGFVVCPPQPLTMQPAEKITPETCHDEEIERVAWLSSGVGFRPTRPEHKDDRAPWIEFDLGKEQEIVALRIWNYNERNIKQRGVAEMDVTEIGSVSLPIGNGLAVDIPFEKPTKMKTVRFTIRSSHAGAKFPIAEGDEVRGTGFVGLAEVQFLVRDSNDPKKLVPLKNVTATASSELVIDSHDRKAKYVVDGSGLGAEPPSRNGWNFQGMPFYAGKVEYSRSFDVEKMDGKYSVKLPDSPNGWYGATARIFVNGCNADSDAGFVVSSPWTVDVTKFVKPGKNDVFVQIYGTPKNLLGPHHAGRLRGSAWPNAFQRGPDKQPAGTAYDTIGYGLFEPFELIQTK